MSVVLPPAVEAWATSPLVESLGWALVHFLWQGAAVAVLLAVLLSCLRGASANVRYVVACLGLVLLALLPLATLGWSLTPAFNIRPVAYDPHDGLIPVQTAYEGKDLEAELRNALAADAPRESHAPVQSAIDSVPEPDPVRSGNWWGDLRPFLAWFVAIWLVGVVALSARLCAGWVWLQCLGRRLARPVAPQWQDALKRVAGQVGVTRSVRLLQSGLVEVPALIGWLRPVILLPVRSVLNLAPRQLEAILAHELAHVRRHDYLANLVQTALETLLFYHPATWYVSRIIRHEREACCDEIAAQVTGDRLEYARALATMEELRGRQPQLVVAAGGGVLLERVRRIMGLPAARTSRSAWWVMAMIVVGVVAAVGLNVSPGAQAGGGNGAQANAADEWGPEAGGLRCRLVATPVDANDETPDLAKTTDKFARGDDATFVVDVKNVSDKPVTLLGVRYGDSYPTAAGKLNTGFFGPHLFELEFTDKAGKPLARATRAYVASMLEISGASAHEIAPGKSLTVLLRPARFNAPMDYRLPPGDYLARVRYRGPSEKALADIRKHWPDKPHVKAWSGLVTSNQVAFTVASDPKAKGPDLTWGETKDGLQAAVDFRRRNNGQAAGDPPGTVPLNTKVDVVLHLKNVSAKTITLVSETWRQEDKVTAKNAAGQEQTLGGSWYSGWPIMVRWTLRPAEVAELPASNLAIAADEEAIKKFEHPVGKTLIARPGKYSFSYTIRIGSIQSKDDKGNVVIPAQDDWQGELITGEETLTVRARSAADDQRERADLFTGRVKFVGNDGKAITQGVFTASSSGRQGKPVLTPIQAGANEIPDCSPSRPQTIYVPAPGYEEAIFYDVALKPKEYKTLELTPATPARFRLVTEKGRPVASAKVRYFNKTSDLASSGPFPTDGIEGPIWATSGNDGRVVLDTLQKTNPYYSNLGDAVYFFYVEAAELPGTLVGGVKAGADLGDVVVGPYLEVRGEIQGTPAELDRFAAEWDQPFEMRTANKGATWQYAVSAKLETKREGNKLTFHLRDLRPGKLRIISNFGPHPHSVSHTYGRRDPKGTDVVVEVDLKESLANLALTPTGRK